MKMRILFWAVVIVSGSVLLSEIGYSEKSPECIKDGIKYGVTEGSFRARWWNYQERAMSYIDGGCYESALSDIEEAIKLRKQLVKEDCDQRRARTYGMHFVDYFGHRERGVALYFLGRLEEAEKELSFSLGCVESSKAQYYLDKVRKSKLELTGADKIPPSLEIIFPAGEVFFTNQLLVELKGIAKDDFFVKDILVNDEPLLLPLAEKEIEFKHQLSLAPGENRIRILARDLTGRQSSKELKIIVDREGPEVTFERIKKLSSAEIELEGVVYDQSGVKSLSIDGKEVRVQEGFFKVRLKLKDSFSFKGIDWALNSTEGIVHIGEEPKGAKREHMMPIRYASLATDFEGFSLSFPKGDAFNRKPQELSKNGYGYLAMNELWLNLKESYDEYTDREPPRIQLKGLTSDQTVYFKELYIEGNVSDTNPLKEFSINGKEFLRTAERRNLFFNQIVELKPGENQILIKAVDTKGNVAEKKIRVVRVIPKVHQIGKRLVVSMLPFYITGPVVEIGEVAYDNLVTAIVEQERFNFVDRTQVDAIVRELKLSSSALVDPETSLKVGKLTSAEAMLLGYVKEAPNSIELYARLVDVESSEILVEKDAFSEDKSLSSLRYLTRGLSMKLRNEFPIVEGKIVREEKGKLVVDLGRSSKIKPGMKMIFFSAESLVNPKTGMSLGVETRELGEGKVIDVSDKLSSVELVKKGKEGALRIGELAITK